MKKERPEQLTTLKIDKVTHSRIKEHCIKNDFYIHLFVEEVINKYLDLKEIKKTNDE
jgi:hypothetical protein